MRHLWWYRLGLLPAPLLGLLLCTAPAAAQDGCGAMVKGIGMPQVKGSRGYGNKGEDGYFLLCREGYVLAHDNDRKTPAWVVEHLTPARFTGPGDRNALNNPFKEDPTLKAENIPRAQLDDYNKKSDGEKRSFDRGHMAPAADMKTTENMTVESFYLSNMAPQQGIGLNRHIWADLEGLARDWTCDRKDLYVITGPIYDDDRPDTLGPDKVAVPTAFYKMAYEPKQRRLIAFILPNQRVDKQGQKAQDALKPYITNLAEVERRSGVKFFTAFDTRERTRLSEMKSVMWMPAQGCGKR